MSAIFGILRFNGGTANSHDLERMGNMLAHRGPDGRKFVADGPVGLGHCLLRVNQEDLFEHQPLIDREANLTLVADCRIDNREELAAAFGLSAADSRDMPDSAFILRAYKKWGEDCAERLLGDFAFAVWDGRQKKLLLGRDHMGQRAVHYHRGRDFFAFATEIKALWALSDVPRVLNDEQIAKNILMEFGFREGATLFEEIFGLPGGGRLAVGTTGKTTASRYWQPQCDPRHLSHGEDYYIDTYRRVFTEIVECRVRRLIRPPALLLSGGFDSSAIAGLAGPTLTAKGQKLITVSYVLPEDYRGPLFCPRSWIEFCRRDMPHLDVRYFMRRDEDMFTGAEKAFLTADAIPVLGEYRDDAMYREASAGGARLLMDGLLGDETLNPRGGDFLAHLLRTGQLRRFLVEFGADLRASGQSLQQMLRSRIIWRLSPYWARRAWKAARRGFAPAWEDRPIATAFAEAQFRAGSVHVSDLAGETRREICWHASRLRTLNNVSNRTRWLRANEAAAFGLDITRPLADKRAVEFGLAIPEELHVKNGRHRHLACRALADVYPPEFQTRRRRQEPLELDWAGMLGRAQPRLMMEAERLSTNATLRRYIDFDKLDAMVRGKIEEARSNRGMLFAARAVRAAQYIAWFRKENVNT